MKSDLQTCCIITVHYLQEVDQGSIYVNPIDIQMETSGGNKDMMEGWV